MRSRTERRLAGVGFSLALCTALILALGLPPEVGIAVASEGAQRSSGASVLRERDGSGASPREYWTPRRLALARPLRVPVLDDENARPSATPSGTWGTAGGLPPQAGRGLPVTPPVGRVDSAQVADQTFYPQRANGKLFFVQGRSRYSCSASVVPSRTHSVILTAGHCVYSLYTGWSKKIFFIPAYRGRARPYGTWGWRAEIVPRAWYRSENPNYDYAAISLRSNARGKVGNVVGELGLRWNAARSQHYRAIGYPSNFGGGDFMWQCLSSLYGQDGGRFGGPPSLGISCDMSFGASGGSWQIEQSDGWYVASVTSHSLRGQPNVLYGPYLTPKINPMLAKLQR